MSAITLPIQAQNPQLRTLNILRDLPAVADLVETCFADTMDAEGRRYLQQMRSAGKDNQFLRWATSAVDTVSMPLSGYVWEEKGEVIGNVSLIPYRHAGKKYYLIANVAVRPDQRRRGLGRALTLAAMQHARARHADEIWLHVRDDNPGAIALYLGLGFRERLRRTAWQAKIEPGLKPEVSGLVIAAGNRRDWVQQELWLRRLYPESMNWYQPMPWNSLRPGLLPALLRFFVDVDTRHWAASRSGKLAAALTWQPVSSASDRLWAAVPPEGGAEALTALLLHARRGLTWRQAAGFRPYRTLVWMQTV
jgi:ribosomal protein S18 acetylase RimI-like enzyme